MMTELILLLSLWPFHHKKGNADAWEHAVAQRQAREAMCAKQGDLWFYMGDDKMIGFSSASCDAAIHNWTIIHVDPVRMSRS